jgi:radical SAM superfamily enzyme YgiQ (UPF0313 family)
MGRVLLISANREHFPEPVFPLGAAYVASALARKGISVRVFDAGLSLFPHRSLGREIAGFRPDFVGLSLRNIDNASYPCTRHYTEGYREIANTVRRYSRAPLLLGGPAFSIFPEELMRLLAADGGVVGDGEDELVRLCSGDTVSLRCADFPELQSVGFPDRIDSMFPHFRKYRTIGVQTARGCPRRCIYCTYPVLEGGRLRLRSPAVVADELAFLYRRHGRRDFFFVDSVFNADEQHMEKVCRAVIGQRIPIRFSCYLAPRMSDPSLFTLLAESGCVAVDFGTDSCSDGMLTSLGKGFSVSDVIETSRACRRAGIDFCHSLIFGGPGETRETVQETTRRMDEINPKAVVAMTGIRIYPGTAIEQIALRDGLIFAGEDLLAPRFYFHGENDGLLPLIAGIASSRRNWFLPGGRDWSSAWGPRLLRLVHRNGPLWRTFREG